jgi:hypothetical protein
LLDEIKPLWEDDQAEILVTQELVKGMLTPNTPKYKLKKRPHSLVDEINRKERYLERAEKDIKAGLIIEADLTKPPFKQGNAIEDLKKEIELLKVRQEKFELALGLDKSTLYISLARR